MFDPKAGFRERRFTFSLFVLSPIFFGVVTMILFALNRRWFVTGSRPLDLLILLAVSVAFSAALRALFPTYVGRDGVRATDGVGRYHDVRWEAMRSVSTFCGFLWVRHGRPGAALTIPIFLDDGKGLRDAVIALAPLGNPLRDYFEGK